MKTEKKKIEKIKLTAEEQSRYEAEVWNNAYDYKTGKYDTEYIKKMGVKLPPLIK